MQTYSLTGGRLPQLDLVSLRIDDPGKLAVLRVIHLIQDVAAFRMQTMIDKVAGECVAVRLRMLNRVITNIYDDALRPLDLKVSQMNILVAAAKMGTARPVEVCEYLHLDVSTLSRNVERMKARGWLEVVPDEDGRSQPFRLTPQGTQAPGKGGSGLERGATAGQEGSWGRFVEQLKPSHEASRRRGRQADFFGHIVAYTIRSP
jgi:hypothetical protein